MAGTVGRKRVHSSAAERQAAFRKSRDVRSVALGSLGESIDSIAAALDRPASEVIHSMLRFALTNRNWKQLGLLPGASGVS